MPLMSLILGIGKGNGIKRRQQMLIDMVMGSLGGAWSSVSDIGGDEPTIVILVLLFLVVWVSYKFQKSTVRYFQEVNNN